MDLIGGHEHTNNARLLPNLRDFDIALFAS